MKPPQHVVAATLIAGGLGCLIISGALFFRSPGQLPPPVLKVDPSPAASNASLQPTAEPALPSDDNAPSHSPSPIAGVPVSRPLLALPSAAAAAPGLPPAELMIGAIHLDTQVVPTRVVNGQWEVASHAAGYMVSTGLPGAPGNLALSGHDDIDGAVFRHLKDVKVGSAVTVRTAAKQFDYVVDAVRYVGPDDVSVLNPTTDSTVTLISCWPDFFTPRAPYNSLRVIVQGKLAQ